MNLEDHPTVRRLSRQVQGVEKQRSAEHVLDGAWLRRLALDCGADDAGLVEIARPGLDSQRDEILRNFPWTKSLLSFVLRMAREPVRGAPRSWLSLRRAAFGPSSRRWVSRWRCIRPRGMRSGSSHTSPPPSRPGTGT